MKRSGTDPYYIGDMRVPFSHIEEQYGLVAPVVVYSILENALRAHWKISIEDHFRELCFFCAQFSEVASRNPFAWTQKARSAEEIGTVNTINRMITFPYTKLMCSNMIVNQAAAVIMTSLAKAEALGIPRDRIVFLRGSGDADGCWMIDF